ncbi:F-box protein DOR [Raphanus sativus]|uniref:F-box protein DOR-like n=1 Tax=Raphanus sativus TaxID=3726 RepID=A0A6J0K5F5_RAPSA|nr:F-box protein DOR-like [Raphanus sativus]KAJ4883423.1 F-box protein DOR [Raphanus sativus]
MISRRQKILEDRQAIVGRLNAGENSLTIPDDLISEIFLRLPVKCIARCRCLSKLWASIINRQDFTDRYLKISSTRPRLLFVFHESRKVFFFSAPQNQEDDNSSPTTSSYHMSFPVDYVEGICSPISGLVCVNNKQILKGRRTPVIVSTICNPSTGQSFTLPRMKTRKKKPDARSFFGYDPVEKQYKVLSMTFADDATEHQVLTLQTGKLSWRMIECGVPHHPGSNSNSVCINGVLYYKTLYGEHIIASFDVRSEKFSFIKVKGPFIHALYPTTVLINFNGKLASISPSGYYLFSKESTSLEMWVLDDIEKEEWSKHIYKLPPTWGKVVGDAILPCSKVTASNEIVLSEYRLRSPFYVFFYSLERGTIRRVEIQGMEAFTHSKVYPFVDHVEDVKRMKGV